MLALTIILKFGKLLSVFANASRYTIRDDYLLSPAKKKQCFLNKNAI